MPISSSLRRPEWLFRREPRGAQRPKVSAYRAIDEPEFLFFHHAGDRLCPPDGPRRRSSSAHLFRGQPLRPRRPFDECRKRREKAPLARDGIGHLAGRYLAPCPKRTTQTETLLQTAPTFSGSVRSEPRILRQRAFSRAICAANSFFRCHLCDNAVGSRLYLTQFQSGTAFSARFCAKTEKRMQVRAAILPPIVGRNARLQAYSVDTMHGPRTSIAWPAEGD